MDWHAFVRTQLADITGDPARDEDIVEELAQHLALRTHELRAAGATTAEAIEEARRELRAHPQLARRLRDADAPRASAPTAPPDQPSSALTGLVHDVRYATRVLLRHQTFAVAAVLTVAIGVGANTAVFSVVNSVLIAPLPYPNADELVTLAQVAPGAPGLGAVSGDLRLSPSMYVTYAEHNRVFQHVGVWFARTAAVTGRGDPEQVRSLAVSDGTLQALGVAPLLGRWLSPEDQEPAARPTAMLAYGYWQRRFGGDPQVIGRTITVDSVGRDIVGVMPAGFQVVTADTDLIVPTRFNRSQLILPGFGFQGLARLKPGLTVADANADVTRMIPIWRNSWPPAPGGRTEVYAQWRIAPAIRPLKQDVIGGVGNALWVLMGTIAIVMLIACANVSNLLLVRAEGRQQELAVRQALGARSWRIVRGLLVESLLIALIGGLVGLALAVGGLRLLVWLGPDSLPRLNEIGIDARALGFTLALSVLAGLLFGAVPAFKYGGRRLAPALHGGSRTASLSRERLHMRSALVVAQVALALVLLVGAGLMMRTFQAMRGVEPGFTHPDLLQIMRVAIPASLVAEPERVTRVQHDMIETLAALPGVTSAAFSTAMPMEGVVPNWDGIRAEGQVLADDQFPPLRLFKNVSPGFFATSGTRVVAGRDLTWGDLYEQRRVVLLSEGLARELWGTPSDAIGKRIGIGRRSIDREVIGVVQDVYDNGVHLPPPATVYWPAMTAGFTPAAATIVARSVTIVLRSERAGTEAFLREVQQAIWSINANLPVAGVRTMREVYEQSLGQASFTLVMLAIAGVMALVLGVIGVYGATAYTVSQRYKEIGVRLALGAQPGEVRRSFVWYGLRLAGVGVAIGLVAALGLTQLMASLLFGVSPLDPLTYGAVAALLTAAACLASYIPARRASSLDPVVALAPG